MENRRAMKPMAINLIFTINTVVNSSWYEYINLCSSGKGLVYTNWKAGEPNNPANDCILIMGVTHGGQWRDMNCDITRSTFCQDVEPGSCRLYAELEPHFRCYYRIGKPWIYRNSL